MGAFDAKLRRRVGVVPLVCCALLFSASCTEQQSTPPSASAPHSATPSPSPSRLSRDVCDDAVVPASQPPAKLSQQGLKAVGQGRIWFIAPQTDYWSDLLERQGAGGRGKFPLWVDQKDLPHVTVQGIRGTTGTGRANLTPTSEGTPGPVPMSLELPGPGCWQVTADSPQGTARILLNVT
ncbi:hypothetical protein ACWGCI_00255 [Streptomyces sp. NPDC054949]